MTRGYDRRACWVCGQLVSTNGLATVNHMRKHVREGVVQEIVPKNILDTYRYERVPGVQASLPPVEGPTGKLAVKPGTLQRKLTPAMVDVLRKMNTGWTLRGDKSETHRWISKGTRHETIRFDTVWGLWKRQLIADDDMFPIMTYRLTVDGKLTAKGL